jgi:hypothetical protein
MSVLSVTSHQKRSPEFTSHQYRLSDRDGEFILTPFSLKPVHVRAKEILDKAQTEFLKNR